MIPVRKCGRRRRAVRALGGEMGVSSYGRWAAAFGLTGLLAMGPSVAQGFPREIRWTHPEPHLLDAVVVLVEGATFAWQPVGPADESGVLTTVVMRLGITSPSRDHVTFMGAAPLKRTWQLSAAGSPSTRSRSSRRRPRTSVARG